MYKRQFIDGLRRNLAGEVSRDEIERNVRYYEEYISSQCSTQGSEEMVINEIGDPRLIARTIIETYKLSHTGRMPKQNHEEVYEEYDESARQSYTSPNHQSVKMEFHTGKGIPFKYKAIGIISLIILLFILFLVGKLMFFVVFRLLFPVIVIAGLIGLISKILR